MISNDMVSRNVGKCLTEYKVENYDEVVKRYDRFVIMSQFDGEIGHINELDFPEGYGYPKQFNEPVCHTGNVMYGVEHDGFLTKLMCIIDSSDWGEIWNH